MTRSAPRLALLGATGSVGQELLALLEQRRLPVSELLLFASDESAGSTLEFHGDDVIVETVEPGRVAECDLVIAAAPGVLEPLLPELRASGAAVVDLSGVLELDPEVPIHLPGRSVEGRWVAVPRGVAAALAIALDPLAREASLERLTVTTLEPAAGAGRRGLDEFQGQTVRTLSAMSGADEPGLIFPRALAFDCLPQVGDFEGSDETLEERRLRHVLRRALSSPALAVEVTRVRVPTFMGALVLAHAAFAKDLSVDRAQELWADTPGLRVEDADLPTPRSALAHEEVCAGRLRLDPDTGALAFALSLDTLRRGAALGAIEAAAQLLAS
jgi:aspartate-semialdehyde dehydrogenase